jgi:Ca2+-binding RTX toxin-like protein
MARNQHFTVDAGSGIDTVYLKSWYMGLPIFSVENGVTTVSLEHFDDNSQTVYYDFAKLIGVEQVIDPRHDFIFNRSGNKFIEGRQFVANGSGTARAESIYGTVGNDTLVGGGGVDHFFGGTGRDTVQLDGTAEMWFATTVGIYQPSTMKLESTDPATPYVLIEKDVENITFLNGSGADQTYTLRMFTSGIVGGVSSANNYIVVNHGITPDQTINLGAGDDGLFGTGDAALIDGGDGNDIISWIEHGQSVRILGGAGDDKIRLQIVPDDPPKTTTVVDGGDGNDYIRVSSYYPLQVRGGRGDDIIEASSGATMLGGPGNDWFRVHTWVEMAGSADGSVGIDVVSFATFTSAELVVTGADGEFTVTDKFSGSTFDLISVEAAHFMDRTIDLTAPFTTYQGNNGKNVKSGSAGIDLMHGGRGDDTLRGRGGDDTLVGDDGNDTLFGDDGDDFLYGGTGNNTLYGGAGSDTFHFRAYTKLYLAHDVIKDFEGGAGSGDVIAFRLEEGLDTYQDIAKLAKQVGRDTVITFESGNTITLEGVNCASLAPDDFIFL